MVSWNFFVDKSIFEIDPILRLLFSLKPKEMAKMRFLAILIDQK